MDQTEIQNQLKLAADALEAQDRAITEANVKLAAAEADKAKLAEENAKLVQAKQASAKADTEQTKNDAAKLAPLAKLAADKLYAKGMLSSPELRDRFAAEIINPVQALEALAKAAEYVEAEPAQKLGTVVPANDAVETSDDVWQRRASAALSKLPTVSR